MTYIDQRIAALREAVSKMTPETWAHYDDTDSTGRQEIVAIGVTVARCYEGNPNGSNDAAGIVALRNHAMLIIDEQAREIERLREQLRLANVDACIAEAEANVYRDAGPTPFQGRTTRRNEYEDEGRN